MKKSKVNVIGVLCAPGIGKPEMMGGIRSKEEAEKWGEKNGYTVVYFWQSRQRVYADRLSKQVETPITKSDHLVQLSESGGALLEVVFWLFVIALVLFVFCRGWAW